MILPPQDQTQAKLRGFEAADGEQTQPPVAAAPPPSWVAAQRVKLHPGKSFPTKNNSGLTVSWQSSEVRRSRS